MALTEEKVFVISDQLAKGDQCSFLRVTIICPDTKAAALSVAHTSRGRSVKEKKYAKQQVTMVPFFDNRANMI